MAPTIPPTAALRILAIAAALVFAACGSDSESLDTTAGSETATTEAVDTAETPATESEGEGSEGEKPVEASTEGVTRFWIKPELIDCVGEAPQRCMQIAEREDGEYLLFYDQIAGFEFVEGISYVLDVRVEDVFDPPADASSLSYTLVEVISES